jgi:hypothetical protein
MRVRSLGDAMESAMLQDEAGDAREGGTNRRKQAGEAREGLGQPVTDSREKEESCGGKNATFPKTRGGAFKRVLVLIFGEDVKH